MTINKIPTFLNPWHFNLNPWHVILEPGFLTKTHTSICHATWTCIMFFVHFFAYSDNLLFSNHFKALCCKVYLLGLDNNFIIIFSLKGVTSWVFIFTLKRKIKLLWNYFNQRKNKTPKGSTQCFFGTDYG